MEVAVGIACLGWVGILSGCGSSLPQPVAKFSIASETNGVVEFRNESTNASKYQWAFGDGSMSTDDSPVHVYEATGTYKVTLVASNDSESGVFYMNESVTVVPVPYVFWMPTHDNGDMTLSIDKKVVGTLTAAFTDGVPDCGNVNCLTDSLGNGDHAWRAEGTGVSFSGSFTTSTTGCHDIRIF